MGLGVAAVPAALGLVDVGGIEVGGHHHPVPQLQGDLHRAREAEGERARGLEEVQLPRADRLHVPHHVDIEGHQELVVEPRVGQMAARPGFVHDVEAHHPGQVADRARDRGEHLPVPRLGLRRAPEVVEAAGDLIGQVVCPPRALALVAQGEVLGADPRGRAVAGEGVPPQVLVHVHDHEDPRGVEALDAGPQLREVGLVELPGPPGHHRIPEGQEADRVDPVREELGDERVVDVDEVPRRALGAPGEVHPPKEQNVS